jgi:uroporphyrinogen decarboxylase
MKTVRLEPTSTKPVWIMRQAGRYLPEYMAVRSKVTFIELCKRPELAAEVTLTAQRVLGVDAAILFADLLPVLEPMGMELEYQKGEGPVLHNRLRTAADVDRLKVLEDLQSVHYVYDAIRLIRKELSPQIPLLGFAGAPFTLASYAIEGGGSKSYAATKTIMYQDRGAWDQLMMTLVRSLIKYVNAQIEAGCQAIQIFDSWAGCLSYHDYEQYVLPYTQQLIQGITGAPVINFLTGNPALLPLQRQGGGAVMGLDWRVDIMDAWNTLGKDVAVQGNLDPILLQTDFDTLKPHVVRLMNQTRGHHGHIFNLGHGVLPETKPELVKDLVKLVHELGQAQ